MAFINQFRYDADFDFIWGGSAAAAANPQLQFFENFPGHFGEQTYGFSNNTLSIHAVNIPLSLSFNKAVVLLSVNVGAGVTRSQSLRMGLYSLNGSTLSLANSISTSFSQSEVANTFSFYAMDQVSSTQNITPGTWYFGFVAAGAGGGGVSIYGNSSINPGNAIPGGFLMGRMTDSTAAMPASIATSDLDITGSDAIRQQYVIITA